MLDDREQRREEGRDGQEAFFEATKGGLEGGE
jgi:hypothetical protein